MKKKMLRRPGIEPRSTAWKAAMLTFTPSTPCRKPFLSKKILNVAVTKYANKVKIKNSFLPGVGFEPTPTIVDQNAYVILKSGAFDRSANLTRLDTNLTPTFK